MPASKGASAVKPAEPLAAEVDFERFAAVDLRAGTVRRAERHPKADRLLVLEVDLGFEVRTVVAGVAESYAPEELLGRRVVVVANLAPRKLRGIESRGMVLATDDASGRPRLLAPDPSARDGARVR
jgi:methionyl-tRNA synthetase